MITFDAATRKFVFTDFRPFSALDAVTKNSVTNNLQALSAYDIVTKNSVTSNLYALSAFDAVTDGIAERNRAGLAAIADGIVAVRERNRAGLAAVVEGIAARNRTGIAAVTEGIAARNRAGLDALAKGLAAQLAAFDAFCATPPFLGGITEMVAAWTGPLDRLRDVAELVEELAAEEATPAEVSAAVAREFPLLDGLIAALPDDKVQWYAFIGLLLTALQIALALRSGQAEPPPSVPRVVVNCTSGSAGVVVRTDQLAAPGPAPTVTVNCSSGTRVGGGAR